MMSATDTDRAWTVLSLLNWGSDYLAARGFDEARLHVDLLLAHVLGVRRLDLYLQFDRPLSAPELAQFKSLFKRRLNHEPLQYITGETEFMGLPLWVDRSVLIPRPETELLVETAVAILKTMGKESPEVLDLGTGSGNIAIALAHFLPGLSVTAVDVSGEALETAARNVARHGVKNVRLEQTDLFGPDLEKRHFDLVLSNPPYVSALEYPTLQAEVRDFEPRAATTDDADGLRFLRRICPLAAATLNEGGAMLVELSYAHGDRAAQIARDAGLSSVDLLGDYAGIRRVLRARKEGEK
jgi:release factor glutamine methyltransferase